MSGQVVSLRDYVDARLRDRDLAAAVAKADLDHRLEGMNEFRAQLADNIGRAEWDEKHRDLERRLEAHDAQLSAGRGRRTALAAVSGAAVAILSVTIGLILSSIPSHEEIGAQVKTEAPWLTDRPEVLARITRLERSELAQNVKLVHIEQLDRFFCRTRVNRGLPGCSP